MAMGTIPVSVSPVVLSHSLSNEDAPGDAGPAYGLDLGHHACQYLPTDE